MSEAFEQMRVRLAIELLRQEVELAADRLIAADQLIRRRDMRAQAIELLLDIGLGGQQQSLLMQPLRDREPSPAR